jgi:transposase
LARAGKSAVIPPRPNRLTPRDFDRHLYKERHLSENFFCKLKQFRAIATCYDKTARNFLAAIHLAAAEISIRTRRRARTEPKNRPTGAPLQGLHLA